MKHRRACLDLTSRNLDLSSFRNTNIKGYTGRVNPKTAAKGVAPQITQRNTVEKWLRSKATVNHLDTRNIFETLTIEDTLCSEYMEDIKPLAGLVIKIKKPVMESNNAKCSTREKIFTGRVCFLESLV